MKKLTLSHKKIEGFLVSSSSRTQKTLITTMPMIEIGSYFSTENWLPDLKWAIESAVNSKNADKVQLIQEELVRGVQDGVVTAPLTLTFAVLGQPELRNTSYQLSSLVFDTSKTYIVGNILGMVAACKINGLKTFLFSSRLSVKEANRKSELRQRMAMEEVEVRIVFDDETGLASNDIIELFKKSSTFDATLSLPHISDGKHLLLDQQFPLKPYIDKLIKETSIESFGGVSFDSKHVKVSGRFITTQYILFKLIVGAAAGVGTQEYSNMTKDIALADGSKLSSKLSDDYLNNITTFLKAWLEPLKDEFANNRSGYHLSPQVWQAMGLTIHNLLNGGASVDELKSAGKALSKLDYSKSAIHWKNCDVMELDSKGRTYKNASSSTRQFRIGLSVYFLQVIDGVS